MVDHIYFGSGMVIVSVKSLKYISRQGQKRGDRLADDQN